MAMDNLFPVNPRPTKPGMVAYVGSIILSALLNGISLAVTTAPLVFLLAKVF